MADNARYRIDKRLSEMEVHLFNIYSQASKELNRAWEKYLSRVRPELDALYDTYEISIFTGNQEIIDKALSDYQAKLKAVTIRDKYYRDMVSEVTNKLANINSEALMYINGEMPFMYMCGYNQMFEDTFQVGISFDLVDSDTVRILATQNPNLLPNKKLNISKDKRWNKKSINSQVLQGILQGESIDKIAKRLQKVTDMNKDSAIRNARTMTTGAENRGRQASYERAEDEGIVLNKVWLATIDGRTRDSHIAIDGEEVGVNDKFSNGLEYPGDPKGRPEEVYNCRCTMVTNIIGFKDANGKVNYVNGGSKGRNKK